MGSVSCLKGKDHLKWQVCISIVCFSFALEEGLQQQNKCCLVSHGVEPHLMGLLGVLDLVQQGWVENELLQLSLWLPLSACVSKEFAFFFSFQLFSKVHVS